MSEPVKAKFDVAFLRISNLEYTVINLDKRRSDTESNVAELQTEKLLEKLKEIES